MTARAARAKRSRTVAGRARRPKQRSTRGAASRPIDFAEPATAAMPRRAPQSFSRRTRPNSETIQWCSFSLPFCVLDHLRHAVQFCGRELGGRKVQQRSDNLLRRAVEMRFEHVLNGATLGLLATDSR